MKDKKKLIITTSIILGVLVLTLGITYAAFTYNRTGETSELILGDIYMKYTENNQLTLSDAMPTSIDKYYTDYKVNPIMVTQEINELSRCVNYLTYTGMPLGNGSMTDFCLGTGTAINGYTFQENLDNGEWFPDELIQEMLSSNIIVQDGESYAVNPVMATQEVVDNELSRCIYIYTSWDYEFDEGSTAETFCKGTGTAFGGYIIQEDLDGMIEQAEQNDESFLENWGGQGLLDAGVIIPKIENLPYFEFTITGKNTYTKEDIWYEIVLNHGDNHDTRNTRIKDELLKFTLVEVENNEIKSVLLNNKIYSSLSNKRIWVETIKANTTDEINKKYRLYMRIDESTVIGNVEEDYTSEEWNDVFASIKVSVTGDFKEKELAYEDKYNVTDESCFTYEIADNEVIITDYDASCGTDIVIPEKINNYNVVEIDQNALGYYFIVTIPSTIKSLPCGGIVTNPTLGLICVEPEV